MYSAILLVLIIHEAKYFVVTSASIILGQKYQFHARGHTKI